uniref:Uncharacterized protein n=1 Tax=Solanum lycopersicum TaxID=4081 RepID=A0A3Q7GLP5_SOLLC
MSQRSSSLGISNPVEWLWFRGSSLESPGETFGSRAGNLSPQQAPQFDPVRHALDIAHNISGCESPSALANDRKESTLLKERLEQRITEKIIQNT